MIWPGLRGKCLKYLDIQFYEPFSKVMDLSKGIQFPNWCVDGKMNIVHNCVDKWQNSHISNQPSIIWEGEEGGSKILTYKELYQEVNRCANASACAGARQRRCDWPVYADDAGNRHCHAGGDKDRRLDPAAIQRLWCRRGCDDAYRMRKPRLCSRQMALSGGVKKVEMKSVADEAAAQVPSLRHVIVLKRTGQEIQMDRKSRSLVA